MNVIDEAFIRAYQPDAAPAPTRQPDVAVTESSDRGGSQETLGSEQVLSPASPEFAMAAEVGESGSLFFQVASTDVAAAEIVPGHTPGSGLPASGLAASGLGASGLGASGLGAEPPTPAIATATAEALVVERPQAETSVVDEAHSEGASARRPLSSFVQPQRAVEAVFRPELEVDAFRWPTVVEELATQWSGNFSNLLTSILTAAEAGRSLIGVAGLCEGVGATTLTLCLARLAAEAGKTTVLVDGNFTDPELATRLGLEVDSGWEQVLSGATPLASSVIYSHGDRLALLPLIAGGLRASEQLDTIHASVTAGVLRYHYDLVLVDLGSVAGGGQTAVARKLAQHLRVDACLLAADEIEPGRLAQFAASAPELANVSLGVIENQTVLAAAS